MIILLYIDPGTGTMLFSFLLGLFSAGYFLLRKLLLKVKLLTKGGRGERQEATISYLIYSDDKRYWNVFRPICERFEQKNIPLEYWTSSEDDPALREKYVNVKCVFVGNINKAAARLNVAEADICLSTTPGLDVYQWKRSKSIKWYVHLFHAVGDATFYRMFGLDYYDAVLMAAGFQKHQIREIEGKHYVKKKELRTVGITYMDELLKRYEQTEKKSNDIPTILLAPSWGKNSILAKYGENIIKALIETGYYVVIRPHPQSLTSEKDIINVLQSKFSDADKLKWNYDNDNFEVLCQSDIMISDFSGVIFDFALVFDKPIIYAESSFDKSVYDASWIDEPIWLLSSLPAIGIPLKEADISNMKALIDRALKDTSLEEGRKRVREEGWENIGQSADRVVDYMIEKRTLLV